MLPNRVFARNSDLSNIYNICVRFNKDDGSDVSPTFTLKEAAAPLFVATILPLHPSFELSRKSGIKDIFVECHWGRTNVRALISTIHKLKEYFLISDEFADEICDELSKLPNAKALSHDGVEWSNKIDTTTVFHREDFYGLMHRPPQLSILTEREAYSFIKLYTEGSFLVFKKNEVHYLLAKFNSELIEFEILSKCQDKPKHLSRIRRQALFTSSSNSNLLFNLKTIKGGLLFGPDGVSVSSFSEFLRHQELKQHFPYYPDLSSIKMLKSKEIDLKRLAIKELWIEDATLSWLPKLPVTLQDLALIYFLDIFISNLNQHSNFDIDSFINTHLYQQSHWVPTYRQHLSLDEIKNNLGILRALANNGHAKSACMLAIISFSGLTEEQRDHLGIYGIGFHLPGLSHQKIKPILRDLETYKEITQNPLLIKEKIFRDLFLLKYFQAKKDNILIDNQLKVIDLIQAVSLDQSFFADHMIISCIDSDKENSTKQLTSNTHLFLDVIKMGRLSLASHIKHLFPDEALKATDEQDRNILHNLTDYLLKNGSAGSYHSLDLFQFVCRRFPSLLTEPDHQGSTVHDEIAHLKLQRTNRWDMEMLAKLDSILAECKLGTTPRL